MKSTNALVNVNGKTTLNTVEHNDCNHDFKPFTLRERRPIMREYCESAKCEKCGALFVKVETF